MYLMGMWRYFSMNEDLRNISSKAIRDYSESFQNEDMREICKLWGQWEIFGIIYDL